MMGQMNKLVEEVKMVSARQKDAEITALEAQINPHFLYNTLDTINWMAINADQYEISSAIGALARILRYGIDKSLSLIHILSGGCSLERSLEGGAWYSRGSKR